MKQEKHSRENQDENGPTTVLHVPVSARREDTKIKGRTIENRENISIFKQLSLKKYNKSEQTMRNNVLGKAAKIRLTYKNKVLLYFKAIECTLRGIPS